MLRLRYNSIRGWLRTRVSSSVMGLVLSAGIHLVLLALLGSTPLVRLPDQADALAKKGGDLSRYERNGAGPDGLSALTSGAALSGPERPLPWGNPVFARGELGPDLFREKGRTIKTHTKRPPALHPPKFTPYSPPALAELAIDPDHDVLTRVLPADYDSKDLEREKRLFHQALAEDLRDCRLDRIPLEEALLKLRYFRLQDELLRRGEKPDFSYAQVRARLDEKMAALRRETSAVPSGEWATALLLAYRQDKIYEEKRGHSLFNSIWYDLYNCRSGSEELLIYFSRYHPELELGTVRGSVRKYDGTVMGHMDPAVKINDRWLIFKTVSMDTVLVEEYTIGELYPLEKIILDYLPELEAELCHLSSPLAVNGEPLAGDFALYTKSDHPLAVKEKAPAILLRRETRPYSGPHRMMGREDRLLHGMLSRYQPLAGERALLDEEDPYGDLLFHLLLSAPGERQALLDLYLRKRVTTYPAHFKRPLRPAAAIPGYGDLLTTIEQGVGGKLELAPGNLVPLARFSGHGEYLAINDQRLAELTRRPTTPGRLPLTAAIREFLFFQAPGPGISAIFPPPAEARDLVTGLLADAYDLSMPAEVELARRARDTSTRAMAIAKAGLLGHSREAQDLLEQRVTLLRQVLAHQPGVVAEGEARSGREVPASLSFAETVAQGGRQGLSPGFIKDLVELLGEGEAVQGFRDYLQPILAATQENNGVVALNRQRTAELLGYFDRYLLLEESRKQIIQAARQLQEQHPEPATRAGAAQFLVSQGLLEPALAGKVYAAYLAQQPFDVRELRALLETGLTGQMARANLHAQIDRISLRGLEKWDPARAGNELVPAELLELDELQRGAVLLGDKEARQRIADKLTALLLAVFAAGAAPDLQDATHYANGLDALSALSRSGTAADAAVFARFLDFGAHDPAGFLFARPLQNWLGPDRYGSLLASARKVQQAKYTEALADLGRWRAQGESPRIAESAQAHQQWLAGYGATLENLAGRVAALSFLNGLAVLEGQVAEAQRLQTAMLAELFRQAEFEQDFAMNFGEDISAVRDQALLHESVFRAVELAGHFAQKSGQAGGLDLNHAPTMRLEGEFIAPCGTTARIVDARNGPANALFTKAGIYFDSLLDAENSPATAARALRDERKLRELLTTQPLAPRTRQELDETETFFQDLDKSDYCDIRRLYVLEKLLRQAVLPENLPAWLLNLARDSFSHEQEYLARIKRSGGVEAIFKDYRTLAKDQFRQRWGEHPFSIRNLYGTLLLVKMGQLRVNQSGEFEAIR